MVPPPPGFPSFPPPVYPFLRWMPAERSSRRHSGSAGFACTRAYFVRHHRSPRRTDFHQGLPPLEYGHPTSSGFSLFRMGNSSCRRIRSSAGFFLCLFPRAFPVSSRRPSLPMAGSRSKIKRIPDVVSFCPFSLPGGRLCLIPKWFLPLPVRLTGLCFPPCAGVREPPAFFRPL